MPEYLAPGVYVEETSFRAKSIEGVSTSTAAFVGLTARGPSSSGSAGMTPPLLTSIADFERIYGPVNDLRLGSGSAPPSVTNYLAHAVRAFFENGGGRLYVARVLPPGAAAATSGALNAGSAPAANEQVSLTARFAGGGLIAGSSDVNLRARLRQIELATTKRLAARQQPGTLVKFGTDHIVIGTTETTAANLDGWNGLADSAAVSIIALSVSVEDPTGTTLDYDGLGFHPAHSRYAGHVLGATPPRAADALSNPIRLDIGSNVDAFELRSALFHGDASERTVELKNGSDGTGAPGIDAYKSALDRVLALEDVSIVAAPGASGLGDANLAAAVNLALISHAETRRSYRIAVLDTPPQLEPQDVRTLKNAIDSTYAALYYPWVVVANPLAGVGAGQSSELALPPSGFVAGIYARTDIERGVWKAPANQTVAGAVRLQRDVRFGEQEVLNPLGINCLRALPNRGIRVWGARTASSDPEWKYVNVRRYFLYLEASIDRGTQWAVFEPNGERLWANIRNAVSDYLYSEWASGALLGETPKQAFFVRCDRSTMTQNDLDNGRLICLIGVAVLKPAEFVILRIGQKTADAQS